MRLVNVLCIILLCSGFWLPGSIMALSTDQNQTIHLTANQMDVDNNKGLSTYRGNVQLQQGSIQLQADQVEVYHIKQAEKIIVTGAPVKFQQQTDQHETVKGEANRVEYYAASEKVVLLNNAHLWLGQKQFSGQRLEYDIRQNIIKGGDKSSEGGRIHITIPPLKKTP